MLSEPQLVSLQRPELLAEDCFLLIIRCDEEGGVRLFGCKARGSWSTIRRPAKILNKERCMHISIIYIYTHVVKRKNRVVRKLGPCDTIIPYRL